MELNFTEIDNLDNNYKDNYQINYQTSYQDIFKDIHKDIHKDSIQNNIKPVIQNKKKNKTKNKTQDNSQSNYANKIQDNSQSNYANKTQDNYPMKNQDNYQNKIIDNYQHQIRDISQNKFQDNYQNNTQEVIQEDQKYWDKTTTTEKKNTKKVSFDDILSNMNLVVNEKGVLQFMAPLIEEEPFYPSTYTYFPIKPQRQVRVNKQYSNPIEPELKNSSIYNKYFKNYNDQSAQQAPLVRVPKTMEEYKRMLLEDRIKRIREKIRISKIKPTKLLFENTGNIVSSTKNNNLRKMSFTPFNI